LLAWFPRCKLECHLNLNSSYAITYGCLRVILLLSGC
jgi:hypothetical protein